MLKDYGGFIRHELALAIPSDVESGQDVAVFGWDFDGFPRETVAIH